MNEGKITQVIGAVLDIQYSKENLPNLYNAIHIPYGDSYIVEMCLEEALGTVVIPLTYNGLPVTGIKQEAFKGCTSLGYGKNTVVTMPESLTTLGAKVFYGCTTIKSVDLKNVATIGEAAFYGCTSLKSATYLATANVGLYAFEDCHEDFVANK